VDDAIDEIRRHVLPAYAGWTGAAVSPVGAGLINRSYLVARADGARAVLQAVSPIFPPEMHGNIAAVTERLAAAGMVTPRLLPTGDGRPYLIAPGGALWRLLTHIDGVSFDVVAGAEQARAAGELVGRFHAAVDGLKHEFVGMRVGVHDTPRHLARLEEAVAAHGAHRLFAEVRPLAEAIRAGAAALPPLPPLAPRVCHGDLKFNNILFAGRTPPDDARAISLIDLDTVGPLSLAFELGDAWRSWCNRAGEDDVNAVLDLEILGASLRGYVAGLGRDLSAPNAARCCSASSGSAASSAPASPPTRFSRRTSAGTPPASPAAVTTTWSAPEASGRSTRRYSPPATSARRCSAPDARRGRPPWLDFQRGRR
jgi:Ser/Thr protein kinase RdoA (MazF antagonist)